MSRETIGELNALGVAHPIELDRDSGRLEVRIGDQVAFIDLNVNGSVLTLIHTEVPVELRGHHVAESLAQSILRFARDNRMTVRPFCPFVARYIRRHPEYEAIIDDSFPWTKREKRGGQ